MSQRIPCRLCGPRPIEEFEYGEVLDPPADLDDDARTLDRAYFHTNPAGPTVERWFHHLGCRRWTTVRRDTTRDFGAEPHLPETD